MTPYVRPQGSRDRQEIPAGDRISMEVLISGEEAPHFAMRRFVLEPGGSMPLHTNLVEHEQYVTKGSAEVRIGDEDFQVSAGDSVFIPGKIPHSYKAGSEGFEFICVVPNLEDRLEIIDKTEN